MKKWYKQPYFERKAWILENMDKLNLSSDETVLLLLIDHARVSGTNLTYNYLSKKMHMKTKELDVLFSKLVSKHYLKITGGQKGIQFSIDELFEFDPEKYELSANNDIYNTLDIVFGRPLSSLELQKATDLINEYGQKSFQEALRTADAMRKLNMSYIEGILRNEKK